MGTISFTPPTDGSTADAADVSTPLQTIYDEFNGGIDNANIASDAAIATSKIADDAGLTADNLADDAVTAPKAADGFVVQVVDTVSTAVATGTTLIPIDDTIPQNTEGDEYMTLAITPKSTTNKLVIEVVAVCSSSAAANNIQVALFQDTTASAIAAVSQNQATATGVATISFSHTMVAGTTSATTFKVRIGGSSAGTTTFNGRSAGRIFGAITKSSIVITEYKAS